MRKSVSLWLFVLFSFGCMTGPDYERPPVDMPDSWRFAEKDAKDVANTAWWEQFGDPVLNELIVAALRGSTDLKIAAARVEEFIGRYRSERAPLFPQISGGALAERVRSSERGQFPLPSTAKNPVTLYEIFLNASWEIDLWGRLRRATEAAGANLLGSEENRRAVILSLVTAVAGAYVNLCDLDNQLEIARRTAKTREEYYRLFTLQFERGFISELELSQARSEYEQAAAAIPQLERAIAQRENAFSILLGRNPGPIPRGKGINELALPAVPAGLPSDLLAQRPDIREAEQALVAANAQAGVARAQYFPAISLTGMFGGTSTELSSLFSGPARTWSWTVPLNAPIFTGGNISGQVKTAEALREQSLLRYRRAVQNAFRDVEDALVDQRRSREQLEAQARQVEALRVTARVARLRYENGYSSYIEVLDAERSLFSAELSYVQAKGGLFQALVNLYKAMGGGWIVEADRLTEGPP